MRHPPRSALSSLTDGRARPTGVPLPHRRPPVCPEGPRRPGRPVRPASGSGDRRRPPGEQVRPGRTEFHGTTGKADAEPPPAPTDLVAPSVDGSAPAPCVTGNRPAGADGTTGRPPGVDHGPHRQHPLNGQGNPHS
jgi:hypothetical protein